jgi:hypothetical protein
MEGIIPTKVTIAVGVRLIGHDGRDHASSKATA